MRALGRLPAHHRAARAQSAGRGHERAAPWENSRVRGNAVVLKAFRKRQTQLTTRGPRLASPSPPDTQPGFFLSFCGSKGATTPRVAPFYFVAFSLAILLSSAAQSHPAGCLPPMVRNALAKADAACGITNLQRYGQARGLQVRDMFPSTPAAVLQISLPEIIPVCAEYLLIIPAACRSM